MYNSFMYYSSDESTQLLFDTAKDMGLQPKMLTEYGFFSINIRNKIGYVFYSNSVLNTHLSAQIANNKHLTRVLLDQYHLPNIPYLLPRKMQEALEFLEIHKKIIVKPTRGSRSHDVHLITKREKLEKFNLGMYILEKYIKGKELRYLVLEGKVIAVLEKKYDSEINDPSIVDRISYPKENWSPSLIKISIQAMQIVGLQFGVVDYLIDTEGIPHILEINAAPALRKFHHPASGPSVNVCRLFLEATMKHFLSSGQNDEGK